MKLGLPKQPSKFTTVTISDAVNSFKLLFSYIGNDMETPLFTMYLPDFGPEAFDADVYYRIKIWHWENNKFKKTDVDTLLHPKDSIACTPFRFEANEYNEFVPVNWELDVDSQTLPENCSNDTRFYIAVIPWVGSINDGRPNMDFIGAQNSFNNTSDFNLSLAQDIESNKLKISVFRYGEHVNIEQLKSEVGEMYKIDNIQSKVVVYLADDENVWGSQQSEDIENGVIITDLPMRWDSLDKNSEWCDGMRLFGWLRFYHEEGGTKINLIGFKTNNLLVSQDMWAYWRGGAEKINGDFTMRNFPSTINKTVQQITNISTTTSSKSGIVQPVFIRVRDVGDIVVHPAVTENICINLDAYKSAVDKFFIQIEGSVFPEIGRNSSGVVFKVIGNNLTGTVSAGVYYVLNENSELVTTGNYQYEY